MPTIYDPKTDQWLQIGPDGQLQAVYTSEEYQNSLSQQQAQPAGMGSLRPAAGLAVANKLTGGASVGSGSLPLGSQASNILSNIPRNTVGSAAMPDGSPGFLLSDGTVVPQDAFTIGDAAGLTTAIVNALDAGNNILRGNRKGVIEGASTGVGTAAGAVLGGPVGAGIGSIVGRTAGRGLAHVFGGHRTEAARKGRTQELLQMGYTPEQLAGRDEDFDYGKVPEWQKDKIDKKGHLTELGRKDPASNWGNYGLRKAFGTDWLNKFSEQDRWAITQAAIDNNLFGDDMGDRTIKDADKLRSLVPDAIKNPAYIASYQEFRKNIPIETATPGSIKKVSAPSTGYQRAPEGASYTSIAPDVVPGRGVTAVDEHGVLRNVAPGSPGASSGAGGKDLSSLMGMLAGGPPPAPKFSRGSINPLAVGEQPVQTSMSLLFNPLLQGR